MAKLTQRAVADALKACRGNISAAARSLQVSRRAISKRVATDARLARYVLDARETRVDAAEDKLGDAIDRGEAWAVCFTLKTLGKTRGYVERSELQATFKDEETAKKEREKQKQHEAQVKKILDDYADIINGGVAVNGTE